MNLIKDHCSFLVIYSVSKNNLSVTDEALTGETFDVRIKPISLKHEGALYKEVFPGKIEAHLSVTVKVRGSNSKWRAI